MKRAVAVLLASVVLLLSTLAHAHKPSDSYLTLSVDGATIRGRWDVALRDLDYAIGIDEDGNGEITWGETKSRHGAIAEYVLSRLTLRAQGAVCTTTLDPSAHAVASHSDGTYAVLHFTATCAEEVRELEVDYELFFDVDPQHRGLLRLDAGTSRTETFSAKERTAKIDLRDAGRLRRFASITREGVFHIWTGYDHILFLLALLLPSVLRREDGAWTPVDRLRPALVDVLRVVTAFTVAHSITLSLAALEVVALPSRLVESAIAASVVLAALNNIRPVLRQDRWMAAFLLGLMHGFGFSSTLMDLDLPRSNLVLTLFGFNLGVEIGQIAIVGVFVPLAFTTRRSPVYRRLGLVLGSAVIAALATIWLIERALLVKILP